MSNSNAPSRRAFLQDAGVAAAGAAVLGSLSLKAEPPAPKAGPQPQGYHVSVDHTLRVGLVGCGGRGTGAAVNAMNADKNAKIIALADAFPDRIVNVRKQLEKEIPDQYAVDDDHCFTGLMCHEQMAQSEVDVVLLATPPHFRPMQLAACVEAGKHIFCEKPVAVDGPGCKSVLETAAKAKEKGLNLVSGLCWRYDVGMRETMDRVLSGAIGDIVAVQTNYLAGTLWHRGQKPEWSEMEYQLRNWLYFTWLSGDHIVEQNVHSIDKALWLNGDKLPTSCFGMGGRQQRTEEMFGNIYDHHAVCYEWADTGVKGFNYTRQMARTFNDTEDYVLGTKGRAKLIGHEINSPEGTWKYEGPRPSMYDVEHEHLFGAIRRGDVINNGEYMTYSTLMAIMGREACYTGEVIKPDDLLNSTVSLKPEAYVLGPAPQYPVAVPAFAKVG